MLIEVCSKLVRGLRDGRHIEGILHFEVNISSRFLDQFVKGKADSDQKCKSNDNDCYYENDSMYFGSLLFDLL